MDYSEDQESEREYQEDQRKLYSGGRRHVCPDCGQENALTDEQKRRGYHCDSCTREVIISMEQGF